MGHRVIYITIPPIVSDIHRSDSIQTARVFRLELEDQGVHEDCPVLKGRPVDVNLISAGIEAQMLVAVFGTVKCLELPAEDNCVVLQSLCSAFLVDSRVMGS